ncbi:MAG: Cell division protein FtsZ 1 [Candidatus Methanofastidiosum methylothiophilum]|uniref:Cell division protein FtsZ 1 n=1 Tax=Candidatus Methanofastidiosum methylothiophilum TaxID=1705564 RepID=A0A150IPS7_9EURY|nr:MAG: Cell division protein FtsZ 1 [Candidatus Methanofastidiosum methylthiophilus]KYC46815.1 MAG: Cell division protein FtsZ 1 [Candidatus Methanofastidiosum methylthiophilus]KYC49259.1 MAG: Cell division protein FtsZ 1 [Candidatus Methanofastidiosum methylthiophilus]
MEESKKGSDSQKLKIMIIGIGDENFRILEAKPQNLDLRTLAIGYDKERLRFLKTEKKFFVNNTLKNKIDFSENIQDLSKVASKVGEEFREYFSVANIVFILTDLSDTNIKLTSILLKLAKDSKAIPIPVIKADDVLSSGKTISKERFSELKKYSNSFIIREDEQRTIFSRGYSPFWEKIEGLYLSLALPSLVNIDFADFRTVINKGGACYIGVGEGKGDKKTINSYEGALKSKFDLDLEEVKGALINIIGNKDLALKESTNVTGHIEERIHKNAEIIWGVSLTDTSPDILKVVIVLSGVIYPELDEYIS